MAKIYTNDISDITAQYPNYTASNRKNASPSYSSVTEAFTVPSTPDSDGKYRIELDYSINGNDTLLCTVNSIALTNTNYGVAVTSNQVGVNWEGVPILEFNADKAGLSGSVTYKPLASVRSASYENQIEAELEAINTNLGGISVDGNNITIGDSDDTVIITGNLTVSGTTTTLNTANLDVEDNIVKLNSNVTGSPVLDAGLEVERGTSANASLTWNETTDKWTMHNGTEPYNIASEQYVDSVETSLINYTDTSVGGAVSYIEGQLTNYLNLTSATNDFTGNSYLRVAGSNRIYFYVNSLELFSNASGGVAIKHNNTTQLLSNGSGLTGYANFNLSSGNLTVSNGTSNFQQTVGSDNRGILVNTKEIGGVAGAGACFIQPNGSGTDGIYRTVFTPNTTGSASAEYHFNASATGANTNTLLVSLGGTRQAAGDNSPNTSISSATLRIRASAITFSETVNSSGLTRDITNNNNCTYNVSGTGSHIFTHGSSNRLVINSSGIELAGGVVTLNNGTSNRIQFGTAGAAVPSAGSLGMKIKLNGANGTMNATDYALGIESNNMWFNSGSSYKWYSGCVQIASLSNAGAFQVNNIGVGGAATSRLLTLTGSFPEMQFVNTAASNKTWHMGGNSTAFSFTETSVGEVMRLNAGGNVTFYGGIIANNATSSSTPIAFGGAGKLYDDGATIHLTGRGYYAFGTNSSQLYLNAPAGRFGYNNGNFEFTTYSNETNPSAIFYYNATASSRSVSIGARLHVGATASAITSGASIQSDSIKIGSLFEATNSGGNKIGFFGAVPVTQQFTLYDPVYATTVAELRDSVVEIHAALLYYGLLTP